MRNLISLIGICILTSCVSVEKAIGPLGIIRIDKEKITKINNEYLVQYYIHFGKATQAYTTRYYTREDGVWVDTGYTGYHVIPKEQRRQAQYSVGVLEEIGVNRRCELKVDIRAERGKIFKDTITRQHYINVE